MLDGMLANIDLADEATFQRFVVEVARLHGWRVAHFPASLSVRGRHLTATAYDAAGYPDLTLAHHELGLLFREVKTAKGTIRPQQREWLRVLHAAGANADVWRPADWNSGRIKQELRGLRGAA